MTGWRAPAVIGLCSLIACTEGDIVDPGALGSVVGQPLAVRVHYADREALARLAAENPPWEVHADEGYAVVQVRGPSEIAALERLGYRVEIDRRLTGMLNAPPPTETDPHGGIPGFPCYRTVEETAADLSELAESNPELATWIDIGDSWEKSISTGHDIHVLRLTSRRVPGPKPVMFVMGAIHAREYTTAELVTRFGEHLVGNYGVDPDVTWLLDHHEIHLLAQSNPDGRKQAEVGAQWRKNTNEGYCSATPSSRGANLNRNYRFEWGHGGSSGNACSEVYRGPTPESEPETQAIAAYVRSVLPDQRDETRGPDEPAPPDATGLFLDIHSYTELVLWPWGFTNALAPNATALATLGRKLAFFNGYRPQRAFELYPTDGTTIDFAYGELGVAAYVFELGTWFFDTCATFETKILPANLQALLYAAKVARTPYLTPAGPEALNVQVDVPAATQGDRVVVTAVLNDSRFSSRNGIEPVQAIARGDVTIDTPPWVDSAPATAMNAKDGSFDQPIEIVDATIETALLPAGKHLLYVQGEDALGNRGPASAAFLEILPSSSSAR